MAAKHYTPPASTHAAYVELFRSPIEYLATAVESEWIGAGGCKKKITLSFGGNISGGTGDTGDATVSGWDESAKDLRRHFGYVSENVESIYVVRLIVKFCVFVYLFENGDIALPVRNEK